jgi:hypothetical protein
MSIVNRKKVPALFRVFWLRLVQLDRNEVEYLLGCMLLTFGYFICLGLVVLMAI